MPSVEAEGARPAFVRLPLANCCFLTAASRCNPLLHAGPRDQSTRTIAGWGNHWTHCEGVERRSSQ